MTNNAIRVERRSNTAADLRRENIFNENLTNKRNTLSNKYEAKSIKANYTAPQQKLSVPETGAGIPYVSKVAETASRGSLAPSRHISCLTSKNMVNS